MKGFVEIVIPDIEGMQETFAESTEHCEISGGIGHA